MYTHWKTAGGRKVAVRRMSDLHLLHAIRAIVEGRLFPAPAIPYANGDEREGMTAGEAMEQAVQAGLRDNWLTVLKAEAIRRGLDWETPPSRKVGLLDFVLDRLKERDMTGSCFTAGLFKKVVHDILVEAGITQPEIDVSNLDGKPSYCHWRTEGGTPIKRDGNDGPA
jgi:hypothetical protein